MSEIPIRREGGCRCGRVRFSVTAAPMITMACHCRGCQRLTASAFSLSVAIPTEAFVVTEGELVPGGLHTEMRHSYCSHCKSWIFTHLPGMDWFVNVRSTLLDEPGDWITPFVETFTSEKLPWVSTPARHSFPQFPPMEAWDGLGRDYRDQARHASNPAPHPG